MGDGPPACLGGHGRDVLVHRSAPGDDGRAGWRGGRERPAFRTVGLPGARLRGRARAVGHGTGEDRSWGWPAAAAPVRGWLRRIVMVADRVLAVLAAVAAQLGTEFVPSSPTADPVAAVAELLGALSVAMARRLCL